MLVGVRYNMQILLRTHQHSKPLVGLRYVLWCWWPRTHIMEGCAITRWATLPHTSLLFVPAGWQWSCDHQKEYVRSYSVSGPTLSHWGSRQKPSLVGISQRVPPYLKTLPVMPLRSQQTAQFVAFAQSDNFSRTLKRCGLQGTADQKHHRHHHQQHRWQHHL